MNVIQHNMQSMFSDRQLGITSKSKTKSEEKLSSGFKINRAGDDAAGLAISEKMRKLIRGLNQGSENVQDGISLIKVADGALGEMTDCLQRIAELSIKAYNGTNSKSDREDIQREINGLLTEVQRISDDTTFNETKLFQKEGTYMVMELDPWHYEYLPEKIDTDKPAWLSVSDTLSKDNSSGITAKQRTDLNAKVRTNTGSDPGPEDDCYDYWGPANPSYDSDGNYTHKKEWTETMQDNASAVIDFGNLANVTDARELYDDLMSLVGCAIGVPCSTCTTHPYGLFFGCHEPELICTAPPVFKGDADLHVDTMVDLSYVSMSSGDSTSVLDKAKSLLSMPKNDETKAKVQEAALQISKALCEASFAAVNQSCMTDRHFDQAVKVSDTAFAVYDYRDEEFFAGKEAITPPDVLTAAKAEVEKRTVIKDPPKTRVVDLPNHIKIQCSDSSTDQLGINLPMLGNKLMGINGYNVARYATVSRYDETETGWQKSWREQEYQKKLKEYYKALDQYKKELDEWEKNKNTTDEWKQYKKEWDEWKKKHDDWEAHKKGVYYDDVFVPGHPAYDEPYEETLVNHSTDQYGEPVETLYTVQKTRHIEATEDSTQRVYYPEPVEPRKPDGPVAPVKPTPPAAPGPIFVSEEVYAPDDVKIIHDAIDYVSKCRAGLGAVENRLEHTYANNRNKEENTTAAESRIRDTDMAKEMVTYSNASIIQQAGQSMLAQTNQSRQGIMTLLG